METTGRIEHLFVVRLWQESSRVAPPGQWRGSVEHVPSGRRIYFVALEELDAFILAQVNLTSLDSRHSS